MKNKTWKNISIGFAISIMIELLTCIIYPIQQEHSLRHEGSNLEIISIFYLLALIFTAGLFFIELAIHKDTWTKLGQVFLTLIHTNYLLWTIKCSCGEA